MCHSVRAENLFSQFFLACAIDTRNTKNCHFCVDMYGLSRQLKIFHFTKFTHSASIVFHYSVRTTDVNCADDDHIGSGVLTIFRSAGYHSYGHKYDTYLSVFWRYSIRIPKSLVHLYNEVESEAILIIFNSCYLNIFFPQKCLLDFIDGNSFRFFTLWTLHIFCSKEWNSHEPMSVNCHT